MSDFEVRYFFLGGGRLQYGSVQKLVKLKRVKTSKINLYDAVSTKPNTTSGAHRIQRFGVSLVSKLTGGWLERS